MRRNTTKPRLRRAGVLALLAAMAVPAGATAAQHLEYRVLTPAGYQSSDRSYPVVYIVPGSGADSASAIKTLELAKYAARGEAIIVVASEVGDAQSNFIVDWFDGTKPLDTSFVRQLVPEVDGRYRTLRDGAHRAIAGYSAGGYSATAIASRHPTMFAGVGSFSGVTDLTWRGLAGELAFESVNVLFYGPGQAFRRWGNPATDQANWDAQNPASLAPRLKGKLVYVASGDGRPSSGDEAAAAGVNLAPQAVTETITGQMAESYHEKLIAAGVTHRYRPHAGLHRSQHWRQDLALWWPLAIDAIRPSSLTARSRAPALRLRVRPRTARAGRLATYRFTVTTFERGRRRAVDRASVRFGGRTIRTNRHGRARLRRRFASPGVRRAVAMKTGYRKDSARVRISAAG